MVNARKFLKLYVFISLLVSGSQALFAPEFKLEEKDFPNAVVKIENCRNVFDIFAPYQKSPAKETGFGSGFFIDLDSVTYILTNYHVVRAACSLTIKMKVLGTEKLAVKLVGVSPSHDLALLKLTERSEKRILEKLSKIPVLPFGSSDCLKRGDKLKTLGYPLAVDDLKTTEGVVSGTQVVNLPDQGFWQPAIQTDAAVNPGNSGGAALNQDGQCVGITFAAVCIAEGTAYVIPLDYVKDVISSLRTTKVYRAPNIGLACNQPITPCISSWLGLPSEGGVFISSVLDGSIPYKFGIMAGDSVISLNGLKIDSSALVETPWGQDKVSALFVAERFLRQEGLKVGLIRAGNPMEIEIPKFQAKDFQETAKKVGLKCPGLEPIKCEILGGCVLSELSINHPYHLCQNMATSSVARRIMQDPGTFYSLLTFLNEENQTKTRIIVDDVLESSVAEVSRVGIRPGMIIKSINGVTIKELSDLSGEIAKSLERQDKFVILKSSGDQEFPINLSDLVEDEARLAALHGYEKEHSTVLATVIKNS